MRVLQAVRHAVQHYRTILVTTALMFGLAGVLFFQYVPGPLRWSARVLWVIATVWLCFTAIQQLRSVRITSKKLVFTLILGCLAYATLNLICHVFIKLMSVRDDRIAPRVITSLAKEHKLGIEAMLNGTGYEQYDREIGWVPRPGYTSNDIRINPQGVRTLREYAIPAPDPERRFLCLGDSFTFGHGVSDTETYPRHAEKLRPGTEWINMGISGSCLTQALLHYRKSGRHFGGKYVVIGFMTDDAKRTVNCFRAFVTPYNPFTKPFAQYKDNVFSIEPNPYQDISDYNRLLSNERQEIERLLQIDYLTWSRQSATTNSILRTAQYIYETMHLEKNIEGLLAREPKKPRKLRKLPSDPYGRLTWDPSENRWNMSTGDGDPYGRAIWNPDSLGFIALTRVFDLFYNEIIADGRIPLIVIIPGPLDVQNHRKQLPRLYETLVSYLKAKQYRYLDFLDPLTSRHRDDLSYDALFYQRHFHGPINKELAEEIIQALQMP